MERLRSVRACNYIMVWIHYHVDHSLFALLCLSVSTVFWYIHVGPYSLNKLLILYSGESCTCLIGP